MDRREEFVQNNPQPNDELLQHWWQSASFGLALSGKASRAVGAAEHAVNAAITARDLIEHQAVYALLDEGHSVREIAERLKLSRSKVGRMAKSLSRGGEMADVGFAIPYNLRQTTRDLVFTGWNLTEDALTKDHPRGTHESNTDAGPTKLGGTNHAD